MYKYIYDGPVKEFGKIINTNWHGETVAFSIEKARSNLKYQYKKKHNKIAGTKIDLPGEIKQVS